MKRWTAVDSLEEKNRWERLSRWLNEQGAPNEYVPWTGGMAAMSNLEGFTGLDHVRLSSRFSPTIVPLLTIQSSWITVLGVIDGMVRQEKNWWPLCALYEVFSTILIELGQEVDARGSVMVAGAGGAARAAVAAFFKAGFRRFSVVNMREAEAKKLIRDVERRFFGLKISFVPIDRIVLLPGETTALVNCADPVEETQLLNELSYLNFLRRPGFIFDLQTRKPSRSPLTNAADSGITTISGADIAARTDVLWAKWAFQIDMDYKAYRAHIEKSVDF